MSMDGLPAGEATQQAYAQAAAEVTAAEGRAPQRPLSAISPLLLGGRRARPFSMGVLAILEAIEHPAFTGEGGGELSIQDTVALLWILLEPDLATVVDAVQAGTWRRAATLAAAEWSLEDMARAKDDVQGMMADIVANTPDFDGGQGNVGRGAQQAPTG